MNYAENMQGPLWPLYCDLLETILNLDASVSQLFFADFGHVFHPCILYIFEVRILFIAG